MNWLSGGFDGDPAKLLGSTESGSSGPVSRQSGWSLMDRIVEMRTHAADVHGAAADKEVVRRRRICDQYDLVAVIRRAARTDEVECLLTQFFIRDLPRLVPVRFQRNAALLHDDRAVLLFWIVGNSSPSLPILASWIINLARGRVPLNNFKIAK